MKKNKLLSGKWALLGGKVYDPYKDQMSKKDILISNGKIEVLGKVKDENGVHVIDCSGKIITTGFTDTRSHFKQPGDGYVETIDSGIASAMAGGYTSVCLMSDNKNPLDNPENIKNIFNSSKDCAIDLLPIGSASINHEGRELCEYGCMVEEGAFAFSDTFSPVKNSQFLKYALEYSGMYGALIVSYPKDEGLSNGGIVNEGPVSTRLGLQGIPNIAESIMVFRDLTIAQGVNQKIHIPLVSTRESIAIIKEFQKKNVRVTADVSPHHIFFNEERISNYDCNAKVYPPLRSEEDRKAIIKAIKDEVITSICSDHYPCSSEDKERDVKHAPFGTISLESAFCLVYTELIKHGFDIKDVIKLFTIGPRNIFNLPKQSIAVGCLANFAVIDPDASWVFNESDIYSKSKNSIALGAELSGKIDLTIFGKHSFGSI